jgi:hypothetical protein
MKSNIQQKWGLEYDGLYRMWKVQNEEGLLLFAILDSIHNNPSNRGQEELAQHICDLHNAWLEEQNNKGGSDE